MGGLFSRQWRRSRGTEHAAALAPPAVENGDVEALLSACQMHLELTGEGGARRFLAAAEAVVPRVVQLRG